VRGKALRGEAPGNQTTAARARTLSMGLTTLKVWQLEYREGFPHYDANLRSCGEDGCFRRTFAPVLRDAYGGVIRVQSCSGAVPSGACGVPTTPTGHPRARRRLATIVSCAGAAIALE
jgi:hypothetical protein